MKPTQHWQKSSFSEGGDGNNCVELATKNSLFMLRESDDPEAIVTTTNNPLTQLLQAVRHGLIDGPRP